VEGYMSREIQQRAVVLVKAAECAAGSSLGFLPLKEPGKEFGCGFSEYGLKLRRGNREEQFYLRIFPTFETKYLRQELLEAYVSEIQNRINAHWDAASPMVSTRVVEIF